MVICDNCGKINDEDVNFCGDVVQKLFPNQRN